MIKYLTFAKSKNGLSYEEFVDYYNNKHIPLCMELLPILKKSTIRRNYLQKDKVIFPPNFKGELEYDVVTETIWHSQETFNEFLAATNNPEIQAKITADEVNVFEKGTRVVIVDVHENKADI
ncbi:EthD domain-containing protein [Saccharicrinis sp. 156]|uniref:EthD domain-containing protein n=1 Tax=Saccharicrinis sp. 156 TaxID=3417574 RepID=UPI003D32FBCE